MRSPCVLPRQRCGVELPGRPPQLDRSVETIDAGDRPAGLLLARFSERRRVPLGDGHIGAVIPEIDGIEIKGEAS